MFRHRPIVIAVLLLAGLMGCGEAAARVAASTPQATTTALGSGALAAFPDVMQSNNYSCGVGCVQGVAQYFGQWGYQDGYARELGTTSENGTHPLRIVGVLRKLKLDATLVEGMTLDDLRRHVAEGTPVIIDYQAYNEKAHFDYRTGWEDGHYSVVVGFTADRVLIEDPSLLGTRGFLSHQELNDRWHDYEVESGKRREYVHMGIVVKGKVVPQPAFTHID